MRAMEKRRSIRHYLPKPVEKEKLYAVLEAARLSQSGNNAQPWAFLVITEEETRRRVMELDHHQTWMMEAPVFLVGIADAAVRKDTTGLVADEACGDLDVKKAIRDTAIALENMALEAVEQGLGTCWTGWYEQQPMKEALGLPADKYICGILTLGYPAEEPSARPRRAFREVVHFEKWEA